MTEKVSNVAAVDEINERTEVTKEKVIGEIKIAIPPNYLQLYEANVKSYKKWLRENEKLQEAADEKETEEEIAEALKACTAHFKRRFAGVVAKDQGERLSPSKLNKIWDNFMKFEYRSFLGAHVNLSMETLLRIGIDKFIYTLGWRKPSDSASWRNNKVRLGTCCHCEDQFIPMMFQHNHGLCMNCRPLYSVTAIRSYILHVMNNSERYENAHHDLLMDFYIMFYHDSRLRLLFLKDTDSAKTLEKILENQDESQ